ncbi:hypothetical protein [Streptomyces sp. NBC_01320]|uniref:hypothetical protein n=1 Tax=Streptomyces sp. NBC_01320 TaxID=2903824 RepID=UPI002E15FA92|nr:hypothetical protein OG395_47540 [Streptomyces sp. NBC_01320]
MNRVALHLKRTTDQGIHDDLLLRLGVWRHACDSYYFASDETPTTGADVAQQLARLLEQWGEQVQQLRPTGGTAFLPFDFSDECTGWLRVTSPDGNHARVEAGWSLIEGWSFYPSDIADTARNVVDFEPVTNTAVDCRIEDLLATIAHNRTEFDVSSR